MYLTQVILTPKICLKERVYDEYALHRVVYSLFPKSEQGRQRVLYVHKGLQHGNHVLLVMSEVEPTGKPEIQKDTRRIAESFLTHRRYAFEVVLNPVKRRTGKPGSPDAGRQITTPITGQLPLLKWFVEKAAASGFSPDETTLEVRVRSAQTFRKSENQVVHHRVCFTGTLTVTDAEAFRQTFQNGMGRGKAFGFGLLQIVPLYD